MNSAAENLLPLVKWSICLKLALRRPLGCGIFFSLTSRASAFYCLYSGIMIKFNLSVCLIVSDLSRYAGYELLQWSFNLSVCLIASDLSRYAGYELFQWSYSVCLICPDPLGLSRSARSGLVMSFVTQLYHVQQSVASQQHL